MGILSCIRNFYLYVYFHGALQPDTKRVFPPRGFLGMTLLVMVFHTGTILYTFNAVGVRFIEGVFTEHLFTFRGSVNLIMILAIVFAVLLTYLVCCFGVRFDEIEPRLAKTKWLAKRSVWKMILLPILSMVMFILSGVLFY